MTENILFVWPNETKEKTHWCYFMNDKIKMFDHSLNTLPALAKNTRIIWIIPSENILLTHVQLPALSKHKLQMALPFALEEQLISDVSTLDFVVGEKEFDTFPVVVISKEKISYWIHLAKEWQILPSEIVPDIFTLPYEENQWFSYTNANRCVIRFNKYSGFAASIQNFSHVFEPVYVKQKSTLNNIVLFNQTKEAVNFPGIPIEKINFISLTEKAYFKKVFLALTHIPYINLLKNNEPTYYRFNIIRMWKNALILTGVGLMLLFSSYLGHIAILKKRNTQLTKNIHAIYYRYFPNASSIVAPKLRLQSKLSRLNFTQKNNIFLMLLTQSGKTFQGTDAKIQEIQFNQREMKINFTVSSFKILNKIIADLKKNHLIIKQKNITLTDKKIQTQLLLQLG